MEHFIKVFDSEWFKPEDVEIKERPEEHWYGVYKNKRVVIVNRGKTIAEFEGRSLNQVIEEFNKQQESE